MGRRDCVRLPPRPEITITLSDAVPEQGPLDPVSVFRTPAGEIVVADGDDTGWQRLLVYDSRGRFQRHIGRKGAGPCEFGQVWWAMPYPGDSIAVFDMAKQAVVILRPDGGCVRSIRVPSGTRTAEQIRAGGFMSAAEAVYPDGSILAYPIGYVDVPPQPGPSWFQHVLLRLDRRGVVLDTLGLFRISEVHWDGSRASQIRYGRNTVRALDGFDLVFGEANRFKLIRFDSAGVPRQIIRRSFVPEPVTYDDKAAAVSRRSSSARGERPVSSARRRNLDQRIASYRWAEYRPAYSSIVIDSPGSIWVEHYRLASPDFLVNDSTPAAYTVFDRAGRWLGDVDVPGRFFLRRVYDDMLFGIWQDEDGVASIRGYALIKPGR
jgi:hypothetical protein